MRDCDSFYLISMHLMRKIKKDVRQDCSGGMIFQADASRGRC